MKLTWFVGLLTVWLAGLIIFNILPTEAPEVTAPAPSLDRPLAPLGGGESTATPAELTAVIARASAPEMAFQQFIQVLPASLRDVPTPSPLQLNDSGLLIVNAQVRNLFEYYLLAVGEEPLEHIVARIRHELSAQLDGEALDQGLALLEGYLQYRNHLGILKNDFEAQRSEGPYQLTQVVAIKHAARAARLSFFSEADAAALFGDEDQYDDYMMARMAVLHDGELSAVQQQHQLAELEAQAPAWIHALDSAALRVKIARQQDAALVSNGVSAERLHEQRVASHGAAAALRLRDRDQAQARWRERVAAYRIDLNALIAGGDQPADKQLIVSLREYHFTGPELARIAALDKVELALVF